MPEQNIDQRATDRRTPNRIEPGRTESERVQRFVDKLARDQFFGKVTISFQHGKVHDVKIEQTRKLDEL